MNLDSSLEIAFLEKPFLRKGFLKLFPKTFLSKVLAVWGLFNDMVDNPSSEGFPHPIDESGIIIRPYPIETLHHSVVIARTLVGATPCGCPKRTQ